MLTLTGLQTIAAAMTRWHDDNLAHEQACVRCHVSTPGALDPTPLCNECAQSVAAMIPDLTKIVSAALAWRLADRDDASDSSVASWYALQLAANDLRAETAKVQP